MSDMTVMINKEAFLILCMRIEGLCAELYHYYSKIYEEMPEASRLWKKTALEEENHQLQFELALRLMNETEFELPKDSLKRVYSVHANLLKYLDQIKIEKPELLTAVSKSIEMEQKLADLHVHTALHFKDESMQNLFKSMSEADSNHVSDMQTFKSCNHHSISRIGC